MKPVQQTAVPLPKGKWRGVAYNLVMKFDVSSTYFVAHARALGTDVGIDFLGMHISPGALVEPRNLTLASMCREYLMRESERIGEALSEARIDMRLSPDNQVIYNVTLETKASGKRIAGALRRVGPLTYEWLHGEGSKEEPKRARRK